jgi:hypothetical protein
MLAHHLLVRPCLIEADGKHAQAIADERKAAQRGHVAHHPVCGGRLPIANELQQRRIIQALKGNPFSTGTRARLGLGTAPEQLVE